MPKGKKGTFIKTSEKRRRERCSIHLYEYNESKNLPNDSIAVDTHPNKNQDESQAMSIQEHLNSSDHVFDTNPISSPCEQLSTENAPENGLDTENESSESPPENLTWRSGRRIVELDKLAEQMKSCWDCGQPLHLHNIQSETRMGFGSILYIDCTCRAMNSVTTNKCHNSKETTRGRKTFDVNTKAALGRYHIYMYMEQHYIPLHYFAIQADIIHSDAVLTLCTSADNL